MSALLLRSGANKVALAPEFVKLRDIVHCRFDKVHCHELSRFGTDTELVTNSVTGFFSPSVASREQPLRPFGRLA